MSRLRGSFNQTSFVRRTCLMQTLTTVIQSVEFAKAKGIKVRFHDRQKNEPAHYCGQCEVSVLKWRE